MGVSHRRLFGGWEPAEVTTYEYDGDRLVRSVTVREPEFTTAESELLLASRRVEADMGQHGIPMSEAMDPSNQHAFEGFKLPKVDFAEKARQDAKDKYYKDWPDANRNGHMWGVRYRDE